MNDPMQLFRQVIIVSGVSSVILGAALLLLTVWRRCWSRWVEKEGAFWKRLGLAGRWGAPLRRFEESRAVVFVVASLLVIHLLLLVFAAGAQAYFAKRLRSPSAPPAQSGRPNPHLTQNWFQRRT
jgi:hypothetical protein